MHKNKTRRIGVTYSSLPELGQAGNLRYFIQEHKVNAGIVGQFRMKSGHQMPALLHQHRIALIAGQHFGIAAHAANDRVRG